MSKNINIKQRREDRENSFILIFEKLFSEDSIEEILSNAVLSRDLIVSDYAVEVAKGAYSNKDEIDEIIEKYARGWKISRISKVSLAILRLAIYEIKYLDEIPNGVSINEAVELAKTYANKDDPSFINGLLGSYARSLGE